MELPASSRVPTKEIHIDPANKRTDLVLDELKLSIAQYGILQPPGLRHDPGRGCYFVIWGNRRVRCAQELNLPEIPAIVFAGELAPADIAVYRAIENEQRVDLKPSERGRTYQELMDLRQITAKDVAELLHISPPTVSRHLAILTHPPDILALIDAGTVPLSTGVSLARLPGDDMRREMLNQIRDRNYTRAQIDDAINGAAGKSASKPRPTRFQCRIGDVSISVAALGLSVDRLTRALAELQRQARKARQSGQDLAALAAQLKEE